MPDAFSSTHETRVCTTGIDACVEMGKLPEAQSLLAAMRTARISPGQGTFHRLMKFHSERGDMDGARRVFKQLREYLQQRRRPAGEPASLPDICAYNTLLAGFVRIDDLIMARAVLDKAKRDGVSPDAQSYATYMHGLCRAGQLREAEAILSEMAETEVMPSVFCYGTLIDNYLRLQQRAAAQRVLGKMSASGLKPSRAIYNMLIRSCCYDQDLPAANQLLLSMQAAGHAPDEVTYGTLLHAAVRSTDAPAALDVLSRMQAQGLSPDMAAYTDLMRLYALIGKPDQAVAAFKQAGEACAGGHDIAAYNCLVSVYVAAGNMQGAESAARQAASVAQQQGMPPPSEAFGVLLKGYQAQLLKGAGNSSMGNGSSSGGSGPRGPGQRSSSDSAIETNAEGVQPLRAQELLRPALASFRYFLASGGKPNKGMSNRVVRLCLTCLDFEAANQVVRALKLVGATASYSQFERWFAEARLKEQKLVQRPIGRPEGRGVERFKWWLGLPNSYYNDG